MSIFTTSMAWMLIGFVTGLIAHEAGHCAAAALTSLPIRRVRIGVGPIVAQAKLGNAELEFRAVPLSAFVAVQITRQTPRLSLAAFLAGGMTVNAVLLAISIWLWRRHAAMDLSDDPLFGFGYAQLVLLGASLIPFWGRISGTRLANDGLQLLLLARGRHSIEVHRTYDELLAHYTPGRPPRMTEASAVLRNLFTTGRTRFDHRQTVETVQGLLAGDVMSPEERMLGIGLLIMRALLSRDPVLGQQLDGWAQQLAALDPDGALTAGTRGIVMVELGQFAAGKVLLDTVARPTFTASDPFDTADYITVHAFIARAEGALGDPRAGRRRLTDVRRAIATNLAYETLRPLVDRIDRELAAKRCKSPV
jgi:hypothetical protein